MVHNTTDRCVVPEWASINRPATRTDIQMALLLAQALCVYLSRKLLLNGRTPAPVIGIAFSAVLPVHRDHGVQEIDKNVTRVMGRAKVISVHYANIKSCKGSRRW